MYCNIIYICIYKHHSFSLKDYIHVFLVPGLPTPLFLLPISIKAFFPLVCSINQLPSSSSKWVVFSLWFNVTMNALTFCMSKMST